jgi:hypothetical protein
MITKAEYAKSYKELYVLLHYVPERYLEKLPVKIIKFFEKNMDQNYDYQVDPNLSYNENKKSHLTTVILGNLFRDYWANPSQREYILKKEKQDREEHQRRLKEIYNPDGIFQNNRDLKAEFIEVEIPELMPTNSSSFKKGNIFTKFIDMIKGLFGM